jgi:signal transduction histidine kinase
VLGSSYKLRSLVHLFIGVALIIFAYRQFAQYNLGQQLTEQVRTELGQGLAKCGQTLPNQELYFQCFARIDADNLITEVVAHAHMYCPPLGSELALASAVIGPCQALRNERTAWRPSPVSGDEPFESAQATVDGQQWYAARLGHAPQGSMLLLRRTDVEHFKDQIWALRDRNLLFALPLVLVGIFLVNLFVTFFALQPLRQLESYMLTLNASNLQGRDQPQPQFVEFRQFLSIFQDLRARLKDSLERARRFAGDASHELRTPLTILRGHCEQLIRSQPVGSATQVQARVIGDEVERLVTIVEKLLLLSRADANSLQPDMQALKLSETLEQMMGDIDPAQSGLQVRAQVQPGIIWMCDRSLVVQMLNNLYANAINYNVPGGWVGITLEQRDNAIELSFENPTSHISDELLARAFERFYRASHGRSIEGHGLGLSLCLEIAKVHAASLSIERRPGEIFRISLLVPLPVKAGLPANVRLG